MHNIGSNVTKDIYSVTKDFYLNKNAVLFNFLFIKRIYHGFHKNMKQHKLFSTLIVLINVSWAANQYIRMISEASCDTEDLSYDANKFSFASQK